MTETFSIHISKQVGFLDLARRAKDLAILTRAGNIAMLAEGKPGVDNAFSLYEGISAPLHPSNVILMDKVSCASSWTNRPTNERDLWADPSQVLVASM